MPTRPTVVAAGLSLAVIAGLLLGGIDVSDSAGTWSGGTSDLLVPQPALADDTAAQPHRWAEGWNVDRRTDPDRPTPHLEVYAEAGGANVVACSGQVVSCSVTASVHRPSSR